MTKNCLKCNKEFDGRKDAKCCSTACRVAYSRNNSPKDVTLNVTLKSPKKMVDYDDITEEQLQLDLENKDIDTLRAEGYTIPNWKRHGCKSREEAFADLLAITQQRKGLYMFQGLVYEI